MKSSREQFEEWFKSYVVEIPDLKLPEMDCGEYVQGEDYEEQFYIMLQAMWMAWQASRAAIEIELPTLIWDMSEVGSQHYDRDEVIDAIQSAGIKVKS